MRVQKGQSIVEFAIILPFLVLFLIGLMYFGLMFSNYVALNDIARDAARSASMLSDAKYKENGYESIRQAYQDNFNNDSSKSASITIDKYYLPNSTYLWDPTRNDDFNIDYGDDREVTVTLRARLDESSGSLAGTFFNVIGGATLRNLTVTYKMYSEVEHETNDD